jgi:hypothetical protein
VQFVWGLLLVFLAVVLTAVGAGALPDPGTTVALQTEPYYRPPKNAQHDPGIVCCYLRPPE